MKSFSIFLVFVFSFGALAFQPNKIIGNNELIAVNSEATNIPLKYKKLVNAFGLLSMSCTATHIGNGYVLTAGHCFWVGSDLAMDLPCDGVTIEWGLRQGLAPYMKSQCERVVYAQRSTTSDFAILKVDPVPDVAVGVELFRTAVAGDSVTIFSHPEQLPLHWSNVCSIESQLDPKLAPGTLQHKCDTNPGSSGATIIDVNTNKIVGIHNGGRSPSAGVGMNYGTFLTNESLLTALRQLGFN